VRSVTFIVAAIAVTAGVAHAAVGGVTTARTYIYVGEKRVGYVDGGQGSGWREGKCSESIGIHPPNRLVEEIPYEGFAMNEEFYDYMQRVSATRWDHYKRYGSSWFQHGKARRVNATRWNVRILGRQIGYVRGPDGPAAALALLSDFPELPDCLRR